MTAQQDYVVGVDIGGTNLRLAVADSTGAVIARWSASTVGEKDPQRIVAMVRNGVNEMLQQVSAAPGQLAAIAVGAPGVTNYDAGIVIATSYLMGWRDVPLRQLLEDEFKVPVVVDNDVNAAAIGESWAGAGKSVDDFMFIAIGTGVGGGLILDRKPFRGKGWVAGEVGYMQIPGVSGKSAVRGKPGSLENEIGGEGIRQQWKCLCSERNLPFNDEPTATEIFDRAVQGDALAVELLARTATLLASIIHNVSVVVNCPLFVLGGSVGMHPALIKATCDVLAEWNYRSRPELKPSELGTDAQLQGTIRLALDAAGLAAK